MNDEALTQRVLEPEVMDSEQEARDYNAMDHSEVNRRFVEDFLSAEPDVSSVLDVGTGTALIPLELCQQAPQAKVLAIDAADWMLKVGQENLQASGLAKRIRLEKIDAKTMPYPDATFTSVMSNSIVHHLPDPENMLRESVRVAKPGAVLFFRDLLRPPTRSELMRLVGTYAAGCNEHQRQMFQDSLFAALSLEEIRSLVQAMGFDPATVQQTTDRHWTWSARKLA